MQQNTITFNPLTPLSNERAADFLDSNGSTDDDASSSQLKGFFRPLRYCGTIDDDASSSQLKGQTQSTILMSNVPTTVWSQRVFVRSRLVISGVRPVFCGFWVPQFFCAKGWTGTDQLCRFMGRYKGRLEWTNPFALVLNFWDTCTWLQPATESMTAKPWW